MKYLSKIIFSICQLCYVTLGFAADCPFNEKITYANGQKGCVSDLSLPEADASGMRFAIVVNKPAYYVAISKQKNCKAFGYGIATMGYSSNPNVKDDAKKAAIDSCKSAGCECAILLDDGNVSSEMLVALNSFKNMQGAGANSGVPSTSVSQSAVKDEKNLSQKIMQEKLRASQEDLEKRLKLSQTKMHDEEVLQKERMRLAIQLDAESKAKDSEIARLKELLETAVNKNQSLTNESNTKKALVIGNDSYAHTPKLANARQDANAMGRTLSELGFKVTVKNDLNEKEMKIALRQFKNEVIGGDEVVIFYAGHGVQIGSVNYLLPIDIKGESEDQVRDDAVQLQRLLDDMSERKAKITLAMIDACRDNPFPKAGRSIGGRGLAPTTAATGQMIIFSAGSGQQALDKLSPSDKNPNGLFTRMLLDEIKVHGVRVDNMIREVRRKVVDAARSVGHEQVPSIYDQVIGDYYFVK